MRQCARATAAALLLLCSCLLTFCISAAHAVTPDAAPLVLHTSLVDLFNAEKSKWSVALSSSATATASEDAATAAEPEAVTWTDMREVWVEAQPLDNAASLLFDLPPPTTSYRMEDVEEEEEENMASAVPIAEKNTVQGDSVLSRAQRRQLFGLPSFSFHGLSCEEYGPAERRHGDGGAVQRGRCYFARDRGDDFFFNYRVEASSADGEEQAAGTTTTTTQRASHSNAVNRLRRARWTEKPQKRSERVHSDAADAAPQRAPLTSWHTSEGSMWTEFIVLPGAELGVVGTEGDVRVGSVRVTENLTQAFDTEGSTRVQLAFTIALFGTKPTSDSPVAIVQMRLTGVTGAFREQAVLHATMAQQASHTSFFNRWVFPVVYIGCLYGLVYGVVWVQEKRKASAAAGAAAATPAPSSAPSATKKQQ
ncbi:putative multi-pass transmembrane protein [Leptomonas seymouri]|uniref:Putative multi-pass transmembrane protein n=1 Tax=Leptomonas seymouri TaxID=5684 RepID=A0A0N0P420_LEPSE|nr:putative multi-pass transmembrane protein [Leptomonas seymouri]|eukprot:KPI84317.1 putative multi-pass transmembrane protein [Leptomonas seymouri]